MSKEVDKTILEQKIQDFIDSTDILPYFIPNKSNGDTASERGVKSLKKYPTLIKRAILAWEIHRNGLNVVKKNKERSTIKPLVFICHPLKANDFDTMDGNVEKARNLCKELALNENIIPISTALYFSSFLNDREHEEHCIGLSMGHSILELCDQVWVYTLEDGPTSGMMQDLHVAVAYGIEIAWKGNW